MPQSTFLGFGFGPIQSALFLYEAYRSGNFSRLVAAEVDDALVNAVRENGHRYTVNIAHDDRVEAVAVEGVELLNPRIPADRTGLVQAAREASEMATALPRVEFFAGGPDSVASILTDALSSGESCPKVIYTGENHNHAAEILLGHLAAALPPDRLTHVQTLNTVIGKMSGVINDSAEIHRLGLDPLTPGASRAILVEAFNRILIDPITLPGFHRGIRVFQEKANLLAFEEAKLFGHNAVHALLGYLAHARGLRTMADIARHGDLLDIGRRAFLQEVGPAMCRKHAGLDPLFTPKGYQAYAEDLLARMINPYLNDLVERVIRDPARKLAWGDRLFGTMRFVLAQGHTPISFAHGAFAAAEYHAGRPLASRDELHHLLTGLWGEDVVRTSPDEVEQLIDMVWLQKHPRPAR